MNVLLINLTRFGDLLQTQAAITDLSRQGHRVGVVCLENFAAVGGLLAHVAHLAPFPGAKLLADLEPRAAGDARTGFGAGAAYGSGHGRHAPGWARATAELLQWKKCLEKDFLPDCVCNLTPTLSARLLARLIAGDKPCTAFGLDRHGFGYSGNGWAGFLQGASASRGVSPFNVVDIFRKAAQLPPGHHASTGGVGAKPPILPDASPARGRAALRRPEKAIIAAARERLEHAAASMHAGNGRNGEREESGNHPQVTSCGPPGAAGDHPNVNQNRFSATIPKGFIALQLGASEDRRRWPVASFAALGGRLWEEERLCPVLLGSGQEKHLAARYADISGAPFIDLCGGTSLAELAGVLCNVSLLVTNDTGTMHLAAGLGTPVLAVFLATAQPFDTGPYLAGSCAVEPDLPCHPCPFGTDCPHNLACRQAISPQTLSDCALRFLRSGTWVPGNAPGDDETDDGRTANAQGCRIWQSAYDGEGCMGLISLSGHDGADRTQWMRLLRTALRRFIDRSQNAPFFLPHSDEAYTFSAEEGRRIQHELERASAVLSLLLQQGKALSEHPLPPLKERFLASWQRAYQALAASPHLAALTVLWLEETQAEGQDLPQVLLVMEQFSSLLSGLSEKILI